LHVNQKHKAKKGVIVMPTDLDRALNATINRFMADDGLLAIDYIEKNGQTLPILKNASPNLRHYFEVMCEKMRITNFWWMGISG
jgi:hypothetical protein